MDDIKIVELYWQRNESAINETKTKYGNYCRSIAYRILKNNEDVDECENDTYLELWRTIPPQKPKMLSTYLGMIARQKAIDKWRMKTADKRGGGEFQMSLDELENCIYDETTISEKLEAEEMAKIISEFLRTLPAKECNVFIRRYWYFDSINDICKRYGYGQSKVKMMLKRTREKLISYLEKEGMLV
jgi:RNA polymerase sigma-70 factor (ECF subfamily)